MSNQTITIVKGSLDIAFRSGRYGKFPIGTLKTNLGIFACRDKWLETLDEGNYQGEFQLAEISLSGYMTRGPVREQRTFIKAVVSSYCFDNMSEIVEEAEIISLDDPILDEGEESAIGVLEPDWLADEPVTEEIVNTEADNEICFVREQLRSVGDNTPWRLGEAITIPADLGRAEQRKIRAFLIENGYKLTNPMTRLWEVEEVEEVAYA